MKWEHYWESESMLRIIIEKMRDMYFAQTFANLVKKYSSGKILEAGCGTGKSLKFLKNPVGLDNSKEAVRIARKYCRCLVIGDIKKLPFKENSFDLTFNQGVMEHFNKAEFDQILKEFKKTSKKTLIIVPSKTSIFTILNPFKEFKKFFSKQELGRLMKRQFKFVKVEYLPNSFFLSIMGYGKK